MTNVSKNFTEAPASQNPALWITAQVLVVLFMLMSAWFTVSLATYGWRHKKWRKEGRSRKIHEQLIFLCALVSPVMAFLRLISSQVVIVVGFDPAANFACEASVDVSIVTYIIALMPAYVCLWIRQNALYADKSLGEIKTGFILVVNWLCLVLIIGCLLIASVQFVYPDLYQASPDGCVLVPVKKSGPDIFFVVIVLLLVFGQCLLLALLIHPLHHYAKTHYNVSLCCIHWRGSLTADESVTDATTTHNHDAVTTARTALPATSMDQTLDTPSTKENPREKINLKDTKLKKKKKSSRSSTGQRLLRTMYRALACAFTCIFADLLAMAIAGFVLPNSVPKVATNAVYDIGLMIRIVAVVMQFDTRKQLLTAPCA